jgi:hypothetical protein
MLSLLVLWAILAITFAFIGMPILYACNAQTCLKKDEDRIFVAIWLGMTALSNLLLFASMFTALSLTVAAFFVAIMLMPYFFSRYQLCATRPKFAFVPVGILLVVTLLTASLAAIMSNGSIEDAGMYHVQMIAWLAEYGSVPGLALINNPFGYTSAWFALEAPLKSEWFHEHIVIGMNSFVFFLMIAQSILKLHRVWLRDADTGDWFFIISFALFCHYFFPSLIFTPSPDLPASLLIIVTAWLVVVLSISNYQTIESVTLRPGLAVLLLASFAVSIKFGSMPLLGIASIYYVFANGFDLRKIWIALAIITPFVAIHMLVSTMTSGCALYPMPYFCTSLPWSLGSENARAVSSTITEFAKWIGPAPSDATRFNWLWREPPNINMYNDKPLMLGLLIANILCGILLYFKRKNIGKDAVFYIALIAIAGIAFAVFIVPNLRFCLGFFLVLPSLTGAIILTELACSNFKKTLCPEIFMALSIFITASFSVYPIITEYLPDIKTVKMMAKLTDEWMLLPWPPIDAPHLERVEGNNFVYYIPSNTGQTPGLCWDAPLPCAPAYLRKVWLRDESAGLKSGFVNVLSAR